MRYSFWKTRAAYILQSVTVIFRKWLDTWTIFLLSYCQTNTIVVMFKMYQQVAEECRGNLTWSREQAASTLISLRILTDLLHKHLQDGRMWCSQYLKVVLSSCLSSPLNWEEVAAAATSTECVIQLLPFNSILSNFMSTHCCPTKKKFCSLTGLQNTERSKTLTYSNLWIAECRDTEPRTCPEPEIPANGGLACARIDNRHYCKPMCKHVSAKLWTGMWLKEL